MRIPYREFDPRAFSFQEHGVLVLEEFWTREEMVEIRRAMSAASWIPLSEMPGVRETFSSCGNWSKAEIGVSERDAFVGRVLMPCVEEYLHSFEHVKGGLLSFNYYRFGAGDCLSIHRDMDSGDSRDPQRNNVRRRIAVATYVHEFWHPDWGGEFMAYRSLERNGEHTLEPTHCIPPDPGQLVLFTVPRYHRVARVDPLAGQHERLSVSGWFMSEHWKEPGM